MRLFTLAVALAVAVAGTARPIDDPAPPAFINMTAQEPRNMTDQDPGNSGSTNLPNYNILELYTEPNQVGHYYQVDRIEVKYSTCLTWLDLDKNGGLTSLVSFKNRQGLPYYCMNYNKPDCRGNVYWWKGVIRINHLKPAWDNQIRSTRCHHGRGPDDYPDPNSG